MNERLREYWGSFRIVGWFRRPERQESPELLSISARIDIVKKLLAETESEYLARTDADPISRRVGRRPVLLDHVESLDKCMRLALRKLVRSGRVSLEDALKKEKRLKGQIKRLRKLVNTETGPISA